SGPQGQRPQERAAHRVRGGRRRVDASVLARAGGVPAAVRPRAQTLAERRADRQSLRRPEPDVLLSADRGIRVETASSRPVAVDRVTSEGASTSRYTTVNGS